MGSLRASLILVLCAAFAVALGLRMADALIGYGPPPPEDYLKAHASDSRTGDARCPAEDVRIPESERTWILTGAGGDWIELAGLGRYFHVYDSASEQTGTLHDIIVLESVRPEDLRLTRVGAHLMICGRHSPFALNLYRQYCHGTADGEPWNNAIEEIVFASAGEIWLADEVIETALDPSDILALTRLDEKEQGKASLEAHPRMWHVRAFSDVLPSGWLSSISCRRDVIDPRPESDGNS